MASKNTPTAEPATQACIGYVSGLLFDLARDIAISEPDYWKVLKAIRA